MIALLPIPVTISRPEALCIASTVLTKLSSKKSISFAIDSLSDKIVFCAEAKMVYLFIKIVAI